MSKKYIIHSVDCTDDPQDVIDYDIHTHGLLKSVGRLDIELLIAKGMDLFLEEGQLVVSTMARRITSDSYNAIYGDKNTHVVQIYGCDIQLKMMVVLESSILDDYNRRVVARLVVADPDGYFPWEPECDENYKQQFTEKDMKEREYILDGRIS